MDEKNMNVRIMNIRRRIDTVIRYLTPLLPLANCHMVEYFTVHHWDNLVPKRLRTQLDVCDAQDSLHKYWSIASNLENGRGNSNCELTSFICNARKHYLALDSDICLSFNQLWRLIKEWGGTSKPEIHVKEFMSTKKSYEVQTMSPIVAAIRELVNASHCVDLGGGRGHLPIVLGLGYGVPTLAVDCDELALRGGQKRDKLIKKQWPSIASKHNSQISHGDIDLHRFVKAFVKRDTKLCQLVIEGFPEHDHTEIKVLLTGLHTCGNLGPDSLHLFMQDKSAVGMFNVPCCYHLLTEAVDGGYLWDMFQRNYGGDSIPSEYGFPMSQYLSGFQLGRNARMLSSQSLERVVALSQMPSRSLLHRAMLQVIIKKHLPDFKVAEGKLKGTTKCQDFMEYFKTADTILNLNLFGKITESYLKDFCNEFEGRWSELVMFYLLRLCLAQVIEGLILLDRLLFLIENRLSKAFLVKLFDPAVSPRCHAIVAIK